MRPLRSYQQAILKTLKRAFFSVRARVDRLLPSVTLHIFKAANLCSFKIGNWEDGTIHPDETA